MVRVVVKLKKEHGKKGVPKPAKITQHLGNEKGKTSTKQTTRRREKERKKRKG